MTYQLVLQFPESDFPDFDQLIELEGAVAECLGNLGDLDGHDIGSGEVNLFILTAQPGKAFEKVRSVEAVARHSSMSAAYRHLDSEEFTVLYPLGLAKFLVA